MGIVGVEERRGDFRTVKLHVWKRGGEGKSLREEGGSERELALLF